MTNSYLLIDLESVVSVDLIDRKNEKIINSNLTTHFRWRYSDAFSIIIV